MKKTKKWHSDVMQLCAEVGPEDGVDPRLIARSLASKPKNYKNHQLCKQAKQTLNSGLSAELRDETLHNLEVLDVTINDDRQFLTVFLSQSSSTRLVDKPLIINKLHAIKGYLHSEITQTVKRKRVPSLKFVWVAAINQGDDDAN